MWFDEFSAPIRPPIYRYTAVGKLLKDEKNDTGNCPLQKSQRSGGIQSLMPSFTIEKISHNAYWVFQSLLLRVNSDEGLNLSKLNQRSAVVQKTVILPLSPPDLFLKHSSLLI